MKRYALLKRNIPEVDKVLTSDFINSGQRVNGLEYLFTQKEKSKQNSWAEVLSVYRKKIKASHKRNAVKVETPISLQGFLKWCAEFSKREAEKGIYVPPFPILSMHNVMSVEWLTGSLPDSLYKHFAEMKTALQVELEIQLAKSPVQLQIVCKH